MEINKSFMKSIFALNIALLGYVPCFAQNFQEFNREINVNQFFNELQGQVGYQGTDIPGQSNSIDELESQGMRNKEANELFSEEAMNKRQQKLDETGFNRNNKGFLDKALHTVKNADKEFDYLKSSTEVCTPTDETVTDSSIETCDQFYQLEEQTCFPKQVIEIDPKYHYQCSKKREVKEKTCFDSIKSIKCKNGAECDMGGIKPGSVASDMMFSFENGILRLGKNQVNSWTGNDCDLFDRTTTFRLKNLHLIKEFTLYYVRFDDYIEIFVNGHSVFAGPDGGKNLQKELSHHWYKINNGHSRTWCERNTDWQRYVNIDLRHYLKEGENSIRMKVFVEGLGHGYMEIRAKQNCCSKWDIQREVKCEHK